MSYKYDLQVKNKKKLKSVFNFNEDLKLGQWGESYVKDILENPAVKIEVKTDDWTVRTSNLAIEFESRGKPSGIATTKADFWCHVIGHFFVVVFPVDFLKKIYKMYKRNPKYVKEMGDWHNGKPSSKAILLPWHELIKLFDKYLKEIKF